jgi:hypothetical protein
MSSGTACRCPDKRDHANWVVTRYRHNNSAFGGYRRQASVYSSVMCRECGAHWRTKAAYVERLPCTDDRG